MLLYAQGSDSGTYIAFIAASGLSRTQQDQSSVGLKSLPVTGEGLHDGVLAFVRRDPPDEQPIDLVAKLDDARLIAGLLDCGDELVGRDHVGQIANLGVTPTF